MKGTKSLYVTNVTVFTEEGAIDQGYVKVNGGRFVEVGRMKDIRDVGENEVISCRSEDCLIPGMIDIHMHGVNGADTMDGEVEALETIATSLTKEGVTSFLATTMTQSVDRIDQAITNIGVFIEQDHFNRQAELLGIHLEGPFISSVRAGAQPIEYIQSPNIEQLTKWQTLASGMIKVITVAPEVEGGLELVREAVKEGIVASIGHSDVTYEDVSAAIDAGARHVTHLFNGMSGLHQREPGLVGAALVRDELFVELIADGIHVRPELFSLIYKQKTSDRIILISDGIRAKQLPEGKYELGGQSVNVLSGRATLADGTLAGSMLSMDQALRNVAKTLSIGMKDLIKMTSTNAAIRLGVDDRKGSIAVGKDADFVVLDKDLQVVLTVCRGQVAYEKERETGI